MGNEQTVEEKMTSDNDDTNKEVADAGSPAEDEASNAEGVATEEDSHGDDEQSMATAPDQEDDEEEDDDDGQNDDKGNSTPRGNSAGDGGDDEASSKADTPSSKADTESPTTKKRKVIPPPARRGRAPAVKGLTIPFRTVKKAMKLDPDIPIVQNEAAIMTTMAAELFLKSLAKESQQIAKNRGRNTIRYEDIAEARSNDPALSFLQTLIP